MTQPFIDRPTGKSLEELLEGAPGVNSDTLDRLLADGGITGDYEPSDAAARELWSLTQRDSGRDLVSWLLELTKYAPFPLVDGGFERAALLAAKVQARHGIGDVLIAAIDKGRKLETGKRS